MQEQDQRWDEMHQQYNARCPARVEVGNFTRAAPFQGGNLGTESPLHPRRPYRSYAPQGTMDRKSKNLFKRLEIL